MREKVSYESIQHLVDHVEQRGNSLRVRFLCNVSGQSVEATSHMSQQRGIGSMARQSIMRQLMWSVRRWIYQLLGRGVQGRIAGEVARNAIRGAEQKVRFSASDRQAATIEAFRTVQHQFVLHPTSQTWTHRSAGQD